MSGVGFAVGTGRCGTKFLAQVFARDPEIASHHERHAFNDAFHRYSRWYGLDLDEAGFLATKRRGVDWDLSAYRYSFEASGFLSLSLASLHRAFDAKFVIMVRRPERVVASYLRKGWYENDPILDDPSRPPTTQDVLLPHHFLGRTMPKGEEFERWRKLTRVGKLSWYWSRLNHELLAQADELPEQATRIQKLENLSYEAFCALRAFLGAPANVTSEVFADVRRRRPNASYGMRTVYDWNEDERREFEAETRGMAERLGYVWSVAKLTEGARPTVSAPLFDRVVNGLRAMSHRSGGRA
jgi:hypothetical protein